MTFNRNFNKSNFRTQITRKQSMFNRFHTRFCATKNPVEKRFLKNEASKICQELSQFAKQWKSFGFGSNAWITRNFTVGRFTNVSKKSTSRKVRRHTKRSYARRTTKRYSRRTSKSYGRRTSRTWSRSRKNRSNVRKSNRTSARRSYRTNARKSYRVGARKSYRSSARKSYRSYVAW